MTITTTGRFYALNLALFGGLFMADTLSETLFLSRFGIAWLPAGLIGAALLGVLSTAAYVPLVGRQRSDRLLVGLALVAAVVGVLLWLALSSGADWAVILLFLLFRPLRDLLIAQVWNYLAEQYDTQEAKRYLPLLGSAGQAAAIAFGISLPILVTFLGPANLLLGWTLTLLAVAAIAMTTPRRLAPVAPPTGAAAGAEAATGPRALLVGQPLVQSMALVSVLVVIMVLFLTYQTGAILVAAFPDAGELSSVYATVGAAANAAAWALQVLGLPRLLRRVGVARAGFLYPGLTLGVGAWLALAPAVGAAVVGQITRTAMRQALQSPVEDLLLNALPVSIKARVRALLRGVVLPGGAVVGSLALLGLQAAGASLTVIGLITLVLAAAALAAAFWSGRQYRAATLSLVRQQNPLDQRRALQDFGAGDPEMIRLLREQFRTAATQEEAIFLAEVLVSLEDPDAESILVERIAAEPGLAVALLSVIAEHKLAGAALARQAPALLASAEGEVRRATLAAMGNRNALPEETGLRLLEDPDPVVRLAAVRLMAHDDRTGHGPAHTALEELLRDQDIEVRAGGVGLLATLAPGRIAAYLADPSPRVRQAAAEAAGEVHNLTRRPDLVAALRTAAGDPAETTRRAALRALAAPDLRPVEVFIAALGDRSPAVRAFAGETLVAIGPGTIPALQARLANADPLTSEALLTVLSRLRGDRRLPELAAFEENTIQQATTTTLQRSALPPPAGPAGELLRADLGDEVHELIERLYRLLAATAGPDTERAIRAGLATDDRRRQAVATEALESLRSPEYARLFTTLAAATTIGPLPQITSRRHTIPPISSPDKIWDELKQNASPWRIALLQATRIEAGLEQPPPVKDPNHVPVAPLLDQSGAAGTAARSIINHQELPMLTPVEKAIFLKAVPAFGGMTTEQLQLLATASAEVSYAAGAGIFEEGDPGDQLFVIVSGRVGIEEQRSRGNVVVRIATLNPKEPFGELSVFDGQPQSTRATAVDDCLLLTIRRDVLLDLIRQYPDLSFEIIKFLSGRLREATSTIAEKTKARPRQVVNLFDKLAGEE